MPERLPDSTLDELDLSLSSDLDIIGLGLGRRPELSSLGKISSTLMRSKASEMLTDRPFTVGLKACRMLGGLVMGSVPVIATEQIAAFRFGCEKRRFSLSLSTNGHQLARQLVSDFR